VSNTQHYGELLKAHRLELTPEDDEDLDKMDVRMIDTSETLSSFPHTRWRLILRDGGTFFFLSFPCRYFNQISIIAPVKEDHLKSSDSCSSQEPLLLREFPMRKLDEQFDVKYEVKFQIRDDGLYISYSFSETSSDHDSYEFFETLEHIS